MTRRRRKSFKHHYYRARFCNIHDYAKVARDLQREERERQPFLAPPPPPPLVPSETLCLSR